VRESIEANPRSDEVLVLTWLHLGRRDVLSVHPPREPQRLYDRREEMLDALVGEYRRTRA
jgi:tRNA (Thr-GGU) A37 N-methylase